MNTIERLYPDVITKENIVNGFLGKSHVSAYDRKSGVHVREHERGLFKPDAYDAKKFAEAVERIAGMKDAPHTTLTIGDTPAVLQAVGATARSMQVAPSVIHKAMRPEVKGHDVPLEVMKNLPALLADPIAVFSSQTEENALVAFVEAKDGSGRNVVVAVHMDAKGSAYNRVNRIASVYGKDNAKTIKDWLNNGLRYLNKEKASEWLHANRLQLPEANTIERLGKDTITKEDIVNGFLGKSHVSALDGKVKQESALLTKSAAFPEPVYVLDV
ncbi:MAG: hypothetical protein LBG69_05150 [Zoogloeaceae bacterium]|nr:hypothetical protein [Zoogloeaceae bacterium]